MSLLRRISKVAQRHGGGAVGMRQQEGKRATIPAPTKGLNTRDALGAMKPDYAICLDNYFPDHGAVRLRKGSREYADGVGAGYVETLIEQYAGSDARFFAVGGGALHDISMTGTAPTALKTGLMSSRWSWANIGGHIVMVSGLDEPERIDLSGALVTPHGWTGLTETAELETVTAFKKRLFFTRRDSPIIYYGPLNGVQGELTEFDLSYVVKSGGNALHIGSMTMDAGQGVDDMFLVFMQHGIVLVYSGIDPSSGGADGFYQVGTFRIGELVGDRPLQNVGGDLFVHTVDGVVSMEALLKRGRSGQRGVSASEAITPSIRDQAAIYGATRGWDSILHPPISWLLFSAPVAGGEQYCMNTQTGAWCRFTGFDARCWGRFQDKLYFGGPMGKVFEAGIGCGRCRLGHQRRCADGVQLPEDARGQADNHAPLNC